MGKQILLRAKFNDALNDSAAKLNQFMLTVNSCNSYEHFDKAGKLSIKGKSNFWDELDELIQKFDTDSYQATSQSKKPTIRQKQT